MNLKTIVGTGLRIFAIYMLFEAIASFISFLGAGFDSKANSVVFIALGLQLTISYICWCFPKTIASKVIPADEAHNDVSVVLDPIKLAQLGVSLMSLYLIIINVWAFIPAIVFYKINFEGNPTELISSVAIAVTGVVLFYNTKKVAALMCK